MIYVAGPGAPEVGRHGDAPQLLMHLERWARTTSLCNRRSRYDRPWRSRLTGVGTAEAALVPRDPAMAAGQTSRR